MIRNAGELIDHVKGAVLGHGATPHTEIRVQIGTLGPVHRMATLHGVQDQRGFHLLLRLDPIPESDG